LQPAAFAQGNKSGGHWQRSNDFLKAYYKNVKLLRIELKMLFC
jgi:hypothetical protein